MAHNMVSPQQRQHLYSVKSQYMVRDDDASSFTSSSPRPEAEGREMLENERGSPSYQEQGNPHSRERGNPLDQRRGNPLALDQHRFRKSNSQPVFFDGKNRNSTDVAFRERQHQKDVRFEESPRKHHETKVHMPGGELLLQELYAEQCEQLEEAQTGTKEAQKERDRFETKCMELQAELTAQIQVNKELKKLLVASMGADLQSQLENMARDRAQLGQELDNTMATLFKERETLERTSIQCDVWRSKFLGSRFQVDELITSRTHLDMLQQESCHALQKLLDERGEMRGHLMKTHRLLHYLSNALQRNQSINHEDAHKPISNVMTLGLVNEQLASTISNVLLGDVKGHHQPQGSKGTGFEFVDWTQAEMLAKDIILNKQPSIKLEQMKQHQAILEGPVPKVNVQHRYHPHTRYENITINCCERCKGDIKVV